MIHNTTNTNVIRASEFLATNAEQDNLIWKCEQLNDKTKKMTGPTTFRVSKGSIGGVGSMYSGMLLLQNMQSKFASHAFSFDDGNKNKLKVPISELLANRGEMSYSDVKKLLQVKCTFQLFSEEKSYQPEEAKDDVAALMQLYKRLCDSAFKQLPDPPKKAVLKPEGFISNKYDNYIETDLAKATLVVNVGSVSERFDDSTEIVLANPETGTFQDLSSECKSVYDFMMLLQNKRMDLVVHVDSCCIKKQGCDVAVMPKLRVHQIIIYNYVRKQQQTIGLNFANRNSQSQEQNK